MNNTRLCGRCKTRKPLDQFYPKSSACKECKRAESRRRWAEPATRAQMKATAAAWKRKNRAKDKEMKARWYHANLDRAHAAHLRERYAITTEDYASLLASQKGVCAICGRAPGGYTIRESRLHVDHCHTTKQVRGLLCKHCNTGLGAFVDDPERLHAAIGYLGKYAT